MREVVVRSPRTSWYVGDAEAPGRAARRVTRQLGRARTLLRASNDLARAVDRVSAGRHRAADARTVHAVALPAPEQRPRSSPFAEGRRPAIAVECEVAPDGSAGPVDQEEGRA